jgi:signal transduction histidine kinase
MSQGSSGHTFTFQQAVLDRFGIMPNALQCAPEAPEIMESFWNFVNGMFIDNPMPSLFKGRLFVYLSRFCEFRYCITRNCAFLIGRGHSSGDPSVQIQTAAQVIRLLKTPSPWQRDMNAVLLRLEAISTPVDWPEPETELEDCLFAAATAVYVEPGHRDRERAALRNALGGQRFERLMGLLTLVRAAHHWTMLHPDLGFEDDVRHMLEQHDELARLLLEDPEASRCELGVELFHEVELLRNLNKQLELEKAKQALEDRYRELEIELTRANRVTVMGQLAASITHEVNQPLAGMVTNAAAGVRWLDAQPPNVEEARQALGRIIRDGERASDVIGRIRALIQKAPPRKVGLRINEAILEVVALTHGEVVKNGVSVQTHLAEGLPLIQGDRVQLQQVILNLILNAVQAMSRVSEGPRELLISTGQEASGGMLVSVQDSGPGLNLETLDRLFDAFYTTKPDGMGMGLSICRSIVEAHGGRLWASRKVGPGATFQFTLPVPSAPEA